MKRLAAIVGFAGLGLMLGEPALVEPSAAPEVPDLYAAKAEGKRGD